MKNPPRNKNALGSGLWAMAPSPEQGFSLVELLIASVVVASAGALLIGGLVAANRSAEIRIDQALSTQLLASQLALLDDQLSSQTPRSGTFPAPLDEFTWTLEWTDTPFTPLVEARLTAAKKGRAAYVVTYRPLVQP